MMSRYIRFTLILLIVVLLFSIAACTPDYAPGEPRTDKTGLNSNILGKIMIVEVHLPGKYNEETEYPVLYLLHDYGSKESSIRQAGFFRMADILTEQGIIEPMIIVAPQIDNSYLLNTTEKNVIYGDDAMTGLYSGMYEEYFTEEVIKYIESTYSVASDREDRFLGGISTGGYAALRMTLANPDMFSKVGGHMPALRTPKMELTDMDLFGWLYPIDAYREKRDISILAVNTDLANLCIYIDCGKKDMYSFPVAEDISEILSNRNADITFVTHEGNHNFDYIVNNTQEYLKFYGGYE